MGPGISSNYDNINYVFTAGCWKVHSAVHKRNNERVCLWQIDKDELEKLIYDPSDQAEYLQNTLNSIQKARKLRHPQILKILEVQEQTTNLAFSSEPVSSYLRAFIGELEIYDSTYIGYQILKGLSFLHNDAKMIHLGLKPSIVFLNESLEVKLLGFDWSVSYIPDSGPTNLPFPTLRISPSHPDIKYVAPEIVKSHECYPQSDIFSFGCLFYEILSSKLPRPVRNLNDVCVPITLNPLPRDINGEFYRLISQCLQQNPASRPTASTLLSQEAFQSTQLKVLRYLDMIITKDAKDKFGFFKGLSKIIHDFSPMIIKVKILPILISECKSDIRFAPVLLGTIFSVSEKFTVSEFTNEIFKKLSFLTTVEDPPQVTIALVQSLPLLLEKTEPSLHKDCIYPILFRSLQSNNLTLRNECMKKLPGIIKKLPENIINTKLLPQIVDLLADIKNSQDINPLLSSIAMCLPQIDCDVFLLEQFPKVFYAWKKNQTKESTEMMMEIIENLKGNERNIMARAMQVAASIVSANVAEPYVKKRMCNWMINTIERFKAVNALDRAYNKPEIAMPAKKRENRIEDLTKSSNNVQQIENSNIFQPQNSNNISFNSNNMPFNNSNNNISFNSNSNASFNGNNNSSFNSNSNASFNANFQPKNNINQRSNDAMFNSNFQPQNNFNDFGQRNNSNLMFGNVNSQQSANNFNDFVPNNSSSNAAFGFPQQKSAKSQDFQYSNSSSQGDLLFGSSNTSSQDLMFNSAQNGFGFSGSNDFAFDAQHRNVKPTPGRTIRETPANGMQLPAPKSNDLLDLF
ncbi:protein kinase [Histomonas meleagridis]|uniref:protein kinase n=1 Tax=Histomonas meleagridis TaxID=135588 RepID=UPI003559C050|nr:protein kinase [Histomonas meleagridis]KAH0805137.1 protein kinase [Histomonas meleagridis]